MVLSLLLTVLGMAEVRRGRACRSRCPCALFTVEPVPEVTFLGPWLRASVGLPGNTSALSSPLVPAGMFLMGLARRLAPVTLVAS